MLNQTNQNTEVQTTSKTMISLHYSNHHGHVKEILESILDQSCLGDVSLKVGPDLREFKCHATILSFCSDFLRTLLQSSEKKDPIIILPEFDAAIIEAVLTYIYTGEISMSATSINGFIEACTLLEIKGIIDQQYKLLDLIATTNPDLINTESPSRDVIKNEEYTVIPTKIPSNTSDDNENFDANDITNIDDEDSMMEEEYVLEEEDTEDPIVVSANNQEITNPIIIPRVITTELPKTKAMSEESPPKKVRLKKEAFAKTKPFLRLEKLNFAFNEVEGSVGSWKHARLLADGTANINAANVQYFKERLEISMAKIYENVVLDDASMDKYKVRMYFCSDPVRLKAFVECRICEKSIQVSYKQKNGKFKQWINSNVLRHVETLHKDQRKFNEQERRTRMSVIPIFT